MQKISLIVNGECQFTVNDSIRGRRRIIKSIKTIRSLYDNDPYFKFFRNYKNKRVTNPFKTKRDEYLKNNPQLKPPERLVVEFVRTN